MVAPVLIPLSVSGEPAAFAAAVEAHRAALETHRSGSEGVPSPRTALAIEDLIQRVPRGDPLPDAFQVRPYEIVDDTPRTPEQNQTLSVLRETLRT